METWTRPPGPDGMSFGGVPLTDEEFSLFVWTVTLERAVDASAALVRAHADVLAAIGLRRDQGPLTIVMHATIEIPQSVRDDAVALFPEGTPFRVEFVRHPLRDFLALGGRIRREGRQGPTGAFFRRHGVTLHDVRARRDLQHVTYVVGGALTVDDTSALRDEADGLGLFAPYERNDVTFAAGSAPHPRRQR